ncbi:hypothetical protein RND81_07G200600 [Saponaria officinalis]|uniref:TPX2 C-terminal domain-containing protein n=1 Tax=Saponaria officinalis TaxID=3572 RepID=A0AAW1JUC0_SAPOF
MAETACLTRSFSNPSEISLDFSQGDPARALGESISFGRYMSESLAWEKWSAFTNNRYLEEAEKYSKPGSVAKMKAYFEAQYGRFGARKHAAREQANNVVGAIDAEDVPDTENVLSSVALDPEPVPLVINSRSSVHESPKVDNPDAENVLSSVALNPEPVPPVINSRSSVHESSKVDNPDLDRFSSGIIGSYSSSAQLKDVQNEAESSVESVVVADEVDAIVIESSVENNVEDAEKKDIITISEYKVTIKEAEQEKLEKETLDSTCEQKPDDYIVKRTKKTSLSKLSSSISRLATPIRCKTERNGTPNSKVSKLSSSFARLTTPVRPRKEGHVTSDSKVAKLSSSLARLATPVHPTLSSRKLVKESIDKKKPISNTLHMSMNVSSDINVMKKPSPASRKAGLGKVFTPLGKIIRDSFASSSTPSRASVNSVSRHQPATPQSETKRSRVALEKSFDRSRKLDQKLKSPCTANVKSSTPSSITFASFSFRTEERAAKRQELIQKRLEKEAEYFQQIENAKVKPTPDYRKSSQSRNLKANAAAFIRTEVLSDNTKMAAPSRLQPPKCERKPTFDLARNKTFRPPQKTPDSKPSSENRKAFPSNLTKTAKRQENASPNIL